MSDIVRELADLYRLSEEELEQLLPSGRAKTFSNRVHWARYYLKQAGLVESNKRAHISITPAGLELLNSGRTSLKAAELKKMSPATGADEIGDETGDVRSDAAPETSSTPDETLAAAHAELQKALASDLIDILRTSSPEFFEKTVVKLLIAMGYGGADGRGAVLGGAGDNGVDGVIDKDPLGVDQVYVQAKRYGAGNNVGSGEIRDFFGALSLKDVSRGIFVTTSLFSPSARHTADKLGARIVLIDGPKLADLMIRYGVGCRVKETFTVSELDDEFFE